MLAWADGVSCGVASWVVVLVVEVVGRRLLVRFLTTSYYSHHHLSFSPPIPSHHSKTKKKTTPPKKSPKKPPIEVQKALGFSAYLGYDDLGHPFLRISRERLGIPFSYAEVQEIP